MTDAPSERPKAFMIEKQANSQASQPLELYHLSHDLRGPLNSILGFTELLVEGIEGPLNETQEADLNAIYQSAQNLLSLINNVVDLSKLEADRLNLTFEAVEPGQVIENVLASDVVGGKPDPVELKVDWPETLPPLRGDQERLEQMITSCLKFILKSQKKGQISLTAESKGETVAVRIHSEDMVIAAEEAPELLELVVRVDSAGRSELGRGGLGLPLARKLAEKHNGRMWVENRAGTGLTFCLELPVQD